MFEAFTFLLLLFKQVKQFQLTKWSYSTGALYVTMHRTTYMHCSVLSEHCSLMSLDILLSRLRRYFGAVAGPTEWTESKGQATKRGMIKMR